MSSLQASSSAPLRFPSFGMLVSIIAVLLTLSGCTSLQKAAKTGDLQTVLSGLTAGKDVNTVDRTGRPLLSLAAGNGQLDVMRELLSRGAELEKKDGAGMTPLFIAAQSNQLSAVQELVVAGASLESSNTEQALTPVMAAAEWGYKAVVEYLLSKGAKAGGRTRENATTLNLLARANARTSQSDGLGTAQLLLANMQAKSPKGGVTAYLNQQDKDGFTALHRAAVSNNSELTALLLRSGANPNLSASVPAHPEPVVAAPAPGAAPAVTGNNFSSLISGLKQRIADTSLAASLSAQRPAVPALEPVPAAAVAVISQWSPLHSAARHCQAGESSFKALLTNGANPLARAGNQLTVLRVLGDCKPTDPAVLVKALLDKAKTKVEPPAFRNYLNELDAEAGETALSRAISNDQAALVGTLLQAGASPNLTNQAGQAPLHLALAKGSPAIVKHLLTARANPNLALPDGRTPLIMLAASGDANNVRALLAAGANPNVADKSGWTPLHSAARHGQLDIVKVLLAARAKPNTQMPDGNTPLHLALNPDVARLLLAARANPDLSNAEGMTVLFGAVQTGNAEYAKVLLNAGANPDKTVNGTPPLYMAVQQNQLPIVSLLLAAKADPNLAATAERWTPLHKAANDGNTQAYNLLLASGANGALRTRDYKTAADLVRERAERLAREEAERLARLEAERLARLEAERMARQEAAEESQRKAQLFSQGLQAFGSAYQGAMAEHAQQQAVARANDAYWQAAIAAQARQREAETAARVQAQRQQQAQQQAAYAEQIAQMQQQAGNQQAAQQAEVARRRAATQASQLQTQQALQRRDEQIKRQMAAIAATPSNVAPIVPRSEAPTPSSTFGAGKVRLCRYAREWEDTRPLCPDPAPDQSSNPSPTSGTGSGSGSGSGIATGSTSTGEGSGTGDSSPGKSGGSGDTGPDKARDYSKYSCWDAPSWCISTTTEWKAAGDAKKFLIHHKNVCQHRVYVSAHYELKTGKYFGGVSGVKAGETWTQDSTQATGRYRVMFIGSKVENEDFVCPKPSGWRELGD